MRQCGIQVLVYCTHSYTLFILFVYHALELIHLPHMCFGYVLQDHARSLLVLKSEIVLGEQFVTC